MWLKQVLERILPRELYRLLGAPYHYVLSFLSALYFGFPGEKLIVIGVTGTKGKSSVCELLSVLFEHAGHTVALSSTIRFKIGTRSLPNRYKMTLPGRGFIQRFLADALREKCTVAIIEVTSESVLQYRHLFLFQNALVFTNLQKEHLESHGSMENYFKAKMRIGNELVSSPKRPRIIVAPRDDAYGKRFLTLPVETVVPFSKEEVSDIRHGNGSDFTYKGVSFHLNQPGDFSVMNSLAAIKTAEAFGADLSTMPLALKDLARIPGRTEEISCGQSFTAVVDYAHTPDSLSALYGAYKDKRKICVLGNTGGGRDTWKRPEMACIAEQMCAEVILTNEDPYDEDPEQIVNAMAAGMQKPPHIIMDRREAIRTALSLAHPGDVVLISGKGTDPYLMEAHGKKTPWSDAQVVTEELQKLLS